MPAMWPPRLLPVLVLLLAACGTALPPAPIGEHAALEHLAAAYRSSLQTFPTGPGNMRPAGRLQFVRQVFREAGYDYEASLVALAAQWDAADADQRDLADLLTLPARGLSGDGLAALYQGDALNAVQYLRHALKQ